MLLAATFWSFLTAVGIAVPIMGAVSWIAFLVYCEARSIEVRLPALLPWSEAAKLRRTRIQTMIEREKIDLFEAKHRSLQKEIVFNDLQDHRLKELTAGKGDEQAPDMSGAEVRRL